MNECSAEKGKISCTGPATTQMLLNTAHTGPRWGFHCQACKRLKGAINKGAF